MTIASFESIIQELFKSDRLLVGLTPILAESPTRATRPLPTLATRATNGGSAQVNRRESGLERLLAISGYSRTRHAGYIDECWLWGSLKLACPV